MLECPEDPVTDSEKEDDDLINMPPPDRVLTRSKSSELRLAIPNQVAEKRSKPFAAADLDVMDKREAPKKPGGLLNFLMK